MSNFGKVCQRAPDLATCPRTFKTQSWPVARVFVAGLLNTFRLVLFETLMQGAAKKHRTQTLTLCWHTSLQAFWLVSIK
jgi:hypothetical protein